MKLQDLIHVAKGDRTYQQLEDAAGGNPGRARWQQLATNSKPMREFPDVETILAMSRALKVQPYVVVKACAESLGIPILSETRLFALMPPGLENLTDKQIDILRSIVADMIESSDPQQGQVYPLAARRGSSRRDGGQDELDT